MKFIAIAFLSLTSSLVMAQFPENIPVFSKPTVKASIYKLTFKDDGNGFFTSVRENLCTLRFEMNVFDLRNLENTGLDSQGDACTAMVDGKSVRMILNVTGAVNNVPFHNDGAKQDSINFGAMLYLVNTDATPSELPTLPFASVGLLDIHNNKPVVIHLGAETKIICDDEGSTKNKKTEFHPKKGGHCQISNPVRVEANIEFETP